MAFTKGYIDLDYGQLHYRECGDGTRVIVLLHQVPSSSAMWERVAPLFAADGYRVLAFDLPGYGMSDPLPVEPSIAEYARSIDSALRSLEVGEVFAFGHHTGGSVSVRMAVDYPERVAGVAVWGYSLVKEDRRQELANEPVPNYDDDGSQVLQWWRWRLLWCSAPDVGHVMARSTAELLLAEERAPLGFHALAKEDHQSLLERLRRPLLLMGGDKDMLLDASRRADEVSTFSRYQHLGVQGTDVADESPELLVRTVGDFFASIG